MTDPLANFPQRVAIGYFNVGGKQQLVQMTPEFFRAFRSVILNIDNIDTTGTGTGDYFGEVFQTAMPVTNAGTEITSGTATLDFSTGNQYASVTITGQAAITEASKARAWFMMDSTADHTDYEHMLVPTNLRCGNIIAGTGFTIHAVADFPLTGTFKVRWEWY